MSARRKGASAPGDINRDARRLLLALAQEGAAPGRADLREGFLVVAAPRNGVTAIIANAPHAAGDALVELNLAHWSGEGRGRRLALLPEGAACARRLEAPRGSDPFAAQHRMLAVRTIAPGGPPLTVDEAESPLSWLGRRKGRNGAPFLAPAQIEAGERFGRDIAVAQLLPRVTSDWSGAAGSGGRGPQQLHVSDLAIAARQRIDRAAVAVGPELSGLLIDICGFQKGLEIVEREHAWPPRAAKVVLRIALERLAAHYGLSSVARGPAGAQKTRRWGTEDYRPLIDPST